jgi:hypothetical protein
MAEERIEPRETSWRQLLPWTELFRGFQVALDVNKLALAAIGILVMALGWWLLAVLFSTGAGDRLSGPNDAAKTNAEQWNRFKRDRDRWNLLHETAGAGKADVTEDEWDQLDSYDEYLIYQDAVAQYKASESQWAGAVAARNDALAKLKEAQNKAVNLQGDPDVNKAQKNLDDAETKLHDLRLDDLVKLLTDPTISQAHNQARIPETKARKLAALSMGEPHAVLPYARLSTWPWFEDRGPNPYLMATGQLGKPWETGRFWDWLLTQQTPVLLEPIAKLLLPVVYLFHPGADWLCQFYFLLVLLWTVLTWSVFGGAITRIAAVQVARNEKISALEALNFTRKRFLSYLAAPLIPMVIIVVLVVGMIFYGYPLMIPYFGDVVMGGLFWPLMIVVGLLLAITLVGLVGWPFMSVTISTQGGTDIWDAFTRAYSYVYQKPWHFIWYTSVAVVYGAVVVFFIGFMGSLTVYLAKWGVSQTPFVSTARPDSLFVYAPTSYHWRDLLLQGATVDHGEPIVGSDGEINEAAYNKWLGRDGAYNGQFANDAKAHPDDRLNWANLFGSFLTSIWLWIAFLLLLGFSYSYFWSSSTIVYLLMRRKVDGEDMDEVTLEDEADGGYANGPLTSPAPAPAVKPNATPLTMVDAPSLRPPAVAPPPGSDASASPAPPGPAPGEASPKTEAGSGPKEPGA